MRALTRWNPFREVARFDPLGDIASLWRDFPTGTLLRGVEEPAPAMRLDVTENDTAYTVKAEIPGVAKEDIGVSIDGNMVSITAETKRENEEKKGDTVVRTERYFGSMARNFTLAHDIDVESADARYADGVLTLTLPKLAGTEAKKLSVH